MTYEFRVWGKTSAEIEAKANILARAFYGDQAFTLTIAATAMHANTGDVLTVEADCYAQARS